MYRMEKLIIGLVVTIIVVGIWETVTEYNDCHNRGGELVHTGGHYRTQWVGKVPHVQYVPHYTCSK